LMAYSTTKCSGGHIRYVRIRAVRSGCVTITKSRYAA
jgi:hypothetical protein